LRWRSSPSSQSRCGGSSISTSDLVASSVTPIVGICLIYWYGTPLAWAGGLLLLAIGAFSLYFLVKRRAGPPL